ncbi:hypothetical protein, partial [Escherichia coli]|uniref:hypothetical protein n=1 Tax=Escherichia coli TaxID=562 RepID=UPI001BAFB9A9
FFFLFFISSSLLLLFCSYCFFANRIRHSRFLYFSWPGRFVYPTDCTVSFSLLRPCASGCGNPQNGSAVSMAGLFLPR